MGKSVSPLVIIVLFFLLCFALPFLVRDFKVYVNTRVEIVRNPTLPNFDAQ